MPDVCGSPPKKYIISQIKASDGTSFVPPSMPPLRVGQTHTLLIRVSSIQGDNARDIPIELLHESIDKSPLMFRAKRLLAPRFLQPKDRQLDSVTL